MEGAIGLGRVASYEFGSRVHTPSAFAKGYLGDSFQHAITIRTSDSHNCFVSII